MTRGSDMSIGKTSNTREKDPYMNEETKVDEDAVANDDKAALSADGFSSVLDNDSEPLSMDTDDVKTERRYEAVSRWMNVHPISSLFIVIALCFCCSFSVLVESQGDQWFILSNGEYILKHGFPYTNPFTVWGGNIVVENWLYALLFTGLWHLFGETQIGVWVLVYSLMFAFLLLTWFLARKVFELDVLQSCVPIMLTSILLQLMFGLRPALMSMVLAFANMCIELCYLKRRQTWLLLLMVPVTWIAFNIQMPLGWYSILIPGCFMLFDVLLVSAGRLRRLSTYMGVVALQVMVTFLNPYGLGGVLFLINSRSAMKYGDNNVENLSVTTCFQSAICMKSGLVVIVTSLAVILFSTVALIMAGARMANISLSSRPMLAGSKNQRSASESFTVPKDPSLNEEFFTVNNDLLRTIVYGSWLMMAAFSLSSWMVMRSCQAFIAVLPVAACLLFVGKRSSSWKIITNMFPFMVLIVSIGLLCLFFRGPVTMDRVHDDYGSAYDLAAAMVARHSKSKEDPIASDGILGSKIGYLGWKVTDDMRPELIEANGITHLKTDHYKEMVDAINDASYAKEYIKKYAPHLKWWVYYDSDMNVSKALNESKDLKKVESQYGVTLYKSLVYKNPPEWNVLDK